MPWTFFQATNEVVTRVPESTKDEMAAAVASCKRAYTDWSQTTILTRQQMMFKLQNLIRDNLVRFIFYVYMLKMHLMSTILARQQMMFLFEI